MRIFKDGITEKVMVSIVVLIVIAGIFIFTAKEDKPTITAPEQAIPTASIPADQSGIDLLEKRLEEKIASNLESIQGVGKTKVLVSYTSSLRKEYARDESITKRTAKETDKEGGTRETVETTESNHLVIAGNSNPLVVEEERPQVDGILVIAQGASDPKIREQIFEAVRVLLNIQPSKINVAPMGGV